MADYSSPLRRKSTYSSPSSRSHNNPPPPEGSLRDTTVNVATAFSNAEQAHQPYRTRSPQFQSSLSNHTSHLGNNYILSPSQRLSHLKRNSENYATLVDSDNDFFGNGQIKPMDLYGHQPSSLSQSSSSDDDLDDNPFEEEELLAMNPSEEEHRRGLIQQRSNTFDRFYSNHGSIAGSSFHSLGDVDYNNNNNGTSTLNRTEEDDYNHDYSNSNINSSSNYKNSHQQQQQQQQRQQQQSKRTSISSPSSRPRIQLALERTFELVMFWVFMVFWVIKEIAVAVFTFIFIVVSSILINPIVFLLQLVGFRSLEPLELPQLKSPLARGGDTDDEHPSRLLTTYSVTQKVSILAVVAFGCYYWIFPWLAIGSVENIPPYLQQQQQLTPLDRLYDLFSSSAPSYWLSSFASSPLSTGHLGDVKPLPAHHDLSMKDRFATLEKTVHGLIQHVEKQDHSSQQQIKTINYHLDQLQQQLTQWSSSQSARMESSLMEQMDKMEKVLATTTTDWTNRWEQWEQKHSGLHHQDDSDDNGVISPQLLHMLREVFVSKTDDDNDNDRWGTFLRHHKPELDQHIQDMMGKWIEEQRRQGTWVDKDTLNETLMAQLVHAYDADDDSNSKLTPEASLMMRNLIDTAIQKYHQDVIGTPDYALATRGAMVITPYTSATFTPHDSTRQHWWWTRWYSQWSQAQVSPMVALTPGTHAGQCWPMLGDHGSLGIRLAEPIAVQAVTMEYPSRAMVANHISSAPKEFEVWGIRSVDEAMANHNKQRSQANGGNDPNMIFLGSFTYDIKSSATSLQTFSLDTNRYIVLQGVVVRIRSNWGHPQYTCLYRVRVHGTPAV